ncbi:MAG TPA: hypothetical protein VIS05_00565 [Ilumatobacter sp.]
MAKRKPPVSRWHNGTTPVEDLAPNEQLAHEIVTEFGDLTPSVVRIMDAELTDDERNVALTAFRNSLGTIGDPNRDPRVAIRNAAS